MHSYLHYFSTYCRRGICTHVTAGLWPPSNPHPFRRCECPSSRNGWPRPHRPPPSPPSPSLSVIQSSFSQPHVVRPFIGDWSGIVVKSGLQDRPGIPPRQLVGRDGASVVRRDRAVNRWRIPMQKSVKKGAPKARAARANSVIFFRPLAHDVRAGLHGPVSKDTRYLNPVFTKPARHQKMRWQVIGSCSGQSSAMLPLSLNNTCSSR